MLGDKFQLAAFKGVPLSFRPGTTSCASRSSSPSRWRSSRSRRSRASCTSARRSTRSALTSRKAPAISNEPPSCGNKARRERAGRRRPMSRATVVLAALGAALAVSSAARRRPTRSTSRTRRATRSASSTPKRRPWSPPLRSAGARAASPSARTASRSIVCASDEDRVEVIDTATMKVVRTLQSGPGSGAVHPASLRQSALRRQRGRRAGHRHRRRRRTRSWPQVPVGVEPEGMGISPDGKMLVNTSETTNMAHFIDTTTYQVIDSVLVDARPRFAEFTKRRPKLWVCAEVGGTVTRDRPEDARDHQDDRASRSPASTPRRSSRSASGSPATARPPSSRSARPTASP